MAFSKVLRSKSRSTLVTIVIDFFKKLFYTVKAFEKVVTVLFDSWSIYGVRPIVVPRLSIALVYQGRHLGSKVTLSLSFKGILQVSTSLRDSTCFSNFLESNAFYEQLRPTLESGTNEKGV
jgi:hypothetical protein